MSAKHMVSKHNRQQAKGWGDGSVGNVLLYEHENLSSNPWHPCKSSAWWLASVILAQVDTGVHESAILAQMEGSCSVSNPV